MTDPLPASPPRPPVRPGPLSCLVGTGIAGTLAYLLYNLTVAIAQTFAAKPIHFHNPLAINIAAAVRTLVVGMSALGTGLFGITALGLLVLTVQVTWQRLTQKASS